MGVFAYVCASQLTFAQNDSCCCCYCCSCPSSVYLPSTLLFLLPLLPSPSSPSSPSISLISLLLLPVTPSPSSPSFSPSSPSSSCYYSSIDTQSALHIYHSKSNESAFDWLNNHIDFRQLCAYAELEQEGRNPIISFPIRRKEKKREEM